MVESPSPALSAPGAWGHLAFDLESTGFNPYRDRIVEFCFIQLAHDLNELGRWTRPVGAHSAGADAEANVDIYRVQRVKPVDDGTNPFMRKLRR